LLLGGVDFSNQFVLLKAGTPPGPYASVEAAQQAGAVTLNYGIFVNNVITFAIVAFAVFLLVRAINRMRRAREAPAAAPAEEVLLLRDIRDSLRMKGLSSERSPQQPPSKADV
jgi:large conductance mechanosensitive channel